MATTRKYELKRRAEHQEETRRRIVEAAVELHTTVGPARASVAAIAERAGVTRPTVYAHFPDARSLLEGWPTRGGARARLRRAIGHALEFRTWQSLVRRQGCTAGEAVQLMVGFACVTGLGNANA